MSDTTDTLPVPASDDSHLPVPAAAPHLVEHAHPEPRQYVLIAVVLVIVTALEVAVSYADQDVIGPNFIILLLASMAFVKFTLVVAWYMHLKTDSPALRRFFIVGLVGAVVLYMIVALALHAWQPGYNHVVKSRDPRASTMPRASFPAFEIHPDVWLIVGALVAVYAIALVRLGPLHAPDPRRPATRLQVTCFGAAMLTMWVASDWPIHELGERYLYSVHMVQHLTFSLVCAPLLLLGTPAWLARLALDRTHLLGVVRRLSRFFPAVIVFNVVFVITHVPAVVSWGLRNGVAHFSLHTLLVLSSLVVWMPVLSPLPEVPRLQPPLRMLFLFAQSVLPTIPASFLAYGDHPLYRDYEHFARLWGISALSDENIAGVLMKTGSGVVLWIVIAIVFFRWYAAEESTSGPVRRKLSRDLDRDLLGLHQP